MTVAFSHGVLEDVEVMDAGFSGAAVFEDRLGILFCELIIHPSCFPVFDPIHSSVCFVSL